MGNLFQHPFLRMRQAVKQPSVYILASQPYGTLYVGVTSKYGFHRLVRLEQYATMPDAIAREKQLKRWHRQWKINLIESESPDWHDLALGIGLPPLPSC